jgi:hypothetical protein
MGKLEQPLIDFYAPAEPAEPVPIGEPLQARKTDPHTSHEAAELANESAQSVSEIILAALHKVWPDGLTSKEIAEETGENYVSVSPMLKPMEKRRLVCRQTVGTTAKGKPSYRTRQNRKGSKAAIWYAVKQQQ